MKTFQQYLEEVNQEKYEFTYDENLILDIIHEIKFIIGEFRDMSFDILPEKIQNLMINLVANGSTKNNEQLEEIAKQKAIRLIQEKPEIIDQIKKEKGFIRERKNFKKEDIIKNIKSFKFTDKILRELLQNKNEDRKHAREIAKRMWTKMIAAVLAGAISFGSVKMYESGKKQEAEEGQRYEMDVFKVKNLQDDLSKAKEILKKTPQYITDSKGKQQLNSAWISANLKVEHLTKIKEQQDKRHPVSGSGYSSKY